VHVTHIVDDRDRDLLGGRHARGASQRRHLRRRGRDRGFTLSTTSP